MKKYFILGNDDRNLKLKEIYKNSGKKLALSLKDADVVIGPIPFSKDNIKVNGDFLKCDELINEIKDKDVVLFGGYISSQIREKFEENNIIYYDVLDFEKLAILNAIPTAEGAIKGAMDAADFTIHGSICLVLGFGRIGKILSKMLIGLGANVVCMARKDKDIAMIKAMGYNSVKLENLDSVLNTADVIFNTVPFVILKKERLDMLNKNVCIIDVASAPGGVDFTYAKEIGLNVKWLLALPSKTAPLSAARYYKEIIDDFEKGDS